MKSAGLPPAVLVAVSAVLPEGTARASTWPKPIHLCIESSWAKRHLHSIRGSCLWRTSKVYRRLRCWAFLRTFIWIPMLLQLSKLLFVMFLSPQVQKITHLIGFTYFISWALAETLMIIAARRKLTEHEVSAALILGRPWRRIVIRDVIEPKFDKHGSLERSLELASAASYFDIASSGSLWSWTSI
jgi:hypothetical protein